MADQDNRKRVNVTSFLKDFVRGASEDELKDKYSLSHSQLTRLVGVLKKNGRIADLELSQREEELTIRFGSPQGPPPNAAVGKVAVELDSGLVLHCPSCGAAVQRDAASCDYCHAHLDFSLKGKTTECPHCLAKTPADGRFCIRCARAVAGLVREGKLVEDRLCPRCQIPLRGKQIGDFSVIACDECSGLFVPHQTFEMMQERRDHVILPVEAIPRGEVNPQSEIRYVRCPVCRNMMNRANFARISGVIIDTCRGHGIWFDAGELAKIMDFIARGGIQKARSVELERIKDEQKIMEIRSLPTVGDRYGTRPFQGMSDPQAGLDILDAVDWIFGVFRK